jgi:hypothetical protein
MDNKTSVKSDGISKALFIGIITRRLLYTLNEAKIVDDGTT